MTFIDSLSISLASGGNYVGGKFGAFSRQVKLENVTSEFMFGIVRKLI
jgi:hypothetical protein